MQAAAGAAPEASGSNMQQNGSVPRADTAQVPELTIILRLWSFFALLLRRGYCATTVILQDA